MSFFQEKLEEMGFFRDKLDKNWFRLEETGFFWKKLVSSGRNGFHMEESRKKPKETKDIIFM